LAFVRLSPYTIFVTRLTCSLLQSLYSPVKLALLLIAQLYKYPPVEPLYG